MPEASALLQGSALSFALLSIGHTVCLSQFQSNHVGYCVRSRPTIESMQSTKYQKSD